MTDRPCGICRGDPQRLAFVNRALAQKTPHTKIEAETREMGFTAKRETIRRHVNVCIPAALTEAQKAGSLLVRHRWQKEPTVRAVPSPTVGPAPEPPTPTPMTSLPAGDDMAVLVRAAAVEKLRAGELKITTQDGLAAQSLLDRREEKKKDRELITQLGILLSRGSEPPPMLDTLVPINVTPTGSGLTPSEDDEPLLLEQ